MAWFWNRAKPKGPDASRLGLLVCGALRERGVSADAAGRWIRLQTGRQLDLRPLAAKLTKADEADWMAWIDRHIDGWSAMGEIYTLQDLQRELLADLKAHGIGATLTADGISVGSGVLRLENLLTECQQLEHAHQRAERFVLLTEQLRIAETAPKSWESIRERVLPRILTADRLDAKGPDATAIALAPNLYAHLSLEEQGVHRPLAPWLVHWNLPPEEAWSDATANLRREQQPFHRCTEADGAFFAKFADYRDALLFLMAPEGFADLPLRGRPVLFAIHEGEVFVAGSEDLDALTLCVTEAERAMVEPGTLHPAPLIQTAASEWEPFTPEPHPLAARIAALHVHHRLELYRRDFDRYAKEEPDRLIAPTEPLKLGDGTWTDAAIWPHCPLWLPETSHVVVVSADLFAVAVLRTDLQQLLPQLTWVEHQFVAYLEATQPFPSERFDELRAVGIDLGKVTPDFGTVH